MLEAQQLQAVPQSNTAAEAIDPSAMVAGGASAAFASTAIDQDLSQQMTNAAADQVPAEVPLFAAAEELGQWSAWANVAYTCDNGTSAAAMNAIKKGEEIVACFCALYMECCRSEMRDITYATYNNVTNNTEQVTEQVLVWIIERWDCVSFCQASALKTMHDRVKVQPWIPAFNIILMVPLAIRFILLVKLTLRVFEQLIRKCVICVRGDDDVECCGVPCSKY